MKITLSPEALERLKKLVDHIRQQRYMDYVMYDLPPRHPNCPTYGRSIVEMFNESMEHKPVIRDAEIDGGE